MVYVTMMSTKRGWITANN